MRSFLCLFLGAALCSACNQKQEVRPQMKQLTEAVYASGTLVPEQEYRVVSAIDGFLQQALITEGDTIKKNQLLFKLSSSDRQAQVDAAAQLVQKTLPVASDHSPAVMDIENRLAAAHIRLENDRKQYERYKNLFEQNAISASNYEKYQLQFETTRREIGSLEQQLQQQRLSSGIQLQQAANQLRLASTSQNQGSIRSFTDGIVYEVSRQTGDMIYPNQPIALIGSGRMIAKLLVDEDDFEKVKEGQKVLITMDAYPGKTFSATLTKIYPLLNKVEQSFRVDAVFNDELPSNVYGLNIEANIVIREKVQALVIPRQAIMKGDSVLLKNGSEYTAVKIKKGVEDKDWVQVTEGIQSVSQSIILQ